MLFAMQQTQQQRLGLVMARHMRDAWKVRGADIALSPRGETRASSRDRDG